MYECPSCGAFWVAHDAIWDYGTWYRKYVRVASREKFEEFIASLRAAKAAEVSACPGLRQLTASDIARVFEIAATTDRNPGSRIRP